VLDLFAGTGALAIEALSRGARSAVLVDRSRAAVKLMRRNLTACKLDDAARVVQWDICRNLNCLAADPQRFDLVFLDPPYQRAMATRALEMLFKSGALRRNARLVVEHAADEAVAPGAGFRIDRQRRYGKTRVSFLTAFHDERRG
jgi:16S rRNA (guanine(966)-N(2))-methyltransferase RsmD